eukprot:m.11050 g.11050  ORF g.11050 m.11050 type:complete len:1055 (-) comp3918_c0_seq1:182-3346(-)
MASFSSCLGVLLVACATLVAAGSPLPPYRLQVNGLQDGAVTAPGLITVRASDIAAPRLSWVVAHGARAQTVFAHRVRVYDAASQVLVWDARHTFVSGVNASTAIVSDGTTTPRPLSVSYTGPALTPDTTYEWEVTWTDGVGRESAPSKRATFHTAPADWSNSQWIGGNAGMYRKEFQLATSTNAATVLHVSGLGFFQAYVNGKRVGSDKLVGAWTTFAKQATYFTYDVSDLVTSGSNAVGVLVGRGWRNKESFPPKSFPSACDSNERMLRLELVSQGKPVLGTDTTWSMSSAGPITSDSVYDGETYDATKEQPGWAEAGFKASGDWSNATVVSCYNPSMEPISIPTIQTFTENKPKRFLHPKSGTTVVDFGDNLSGFCRLKVKGPKGTTVTLRHAEVLQHPPYGPVDGNVYMGNLRSAKATDTYTLRGDPNGETWEPHFTYHGFQYVEVTGYPGNLTEDSLTQVHFRTANPVKSSFNSSSTTLNAIQLNALLGQGSNSMSVPTDCDQRDERLGWMGDAGLSADTFAINYDVTAFQNNYVQNMVVEMIGGSLPDTVPFSRYGNRPADPSWSAAFPQNLYVQYSLAGNLDLARRYWTELGSYLDEIVAQKNKAGGFAKWKPSYGDWVPAGKKVPGEVCSAANLIVNVEQALALAQALKATSNATQLASLKASLVAEFNTAFFDASKKCWSDCGQSSYALAAACGAAAAAGVSNATVASALAHDVASNQNHVTVGIIGAKSLFPVMSSGGQHAAAVDLAEVVTFPSWGYMLFNTVEPATTSLWELWDGPTQGPGMNSRNHHMFSSLSAWLVQRVGGVVMQGDERVGVELEACSVAGVSRATTTVRSHRGDVHLSYARHGGVQCLKLPETRSAQRPLARAAVDNDAATVLDCGEHGGIVASVDIAVFGVAPAEGTCGAFVDAATGVDVSRSVAALCVGRRSCMLPSSADAWADNEAATPKQSSGSAEAHNPRSLVVQVTCTEPNRVVVEAALPPATTGTLRVPHAYWTAADGSMPVVCDHQENSTAAVPHAQTADHVVVELASGTHHLDLSTPTTARC